MKAFILLLATLLFLTACTQHKPVPIMYGQDMGEYCGMIISDKRFGAEIITAKQKVYKFDSIESMIAFRLETLKDEAIHSLWVTDFANPGTLITAESAYYLKARTIHSSMGLGLIAFANEVDAKRTQAEDGGAFTSFENLENIVKTADFFQLANAGSEHQHGAHE